MNIVQYHRREYPRFRRDGSGSAPRGVGWTSLRPLLLATGFLLLPARADEAGVNPVVATSPVNLDEVVVTGQIRGVSKMKSSVSISTLDFEQIEQSQSTSAAEVLHLIPGVRSESSGGEGNANLTVRGLPISAGGARYVQLQEDGLPVLQFGDIAFATPDSFLRIDGGLDRLEVVRGGSASILATNSPGGIVNFISKTGEDAGGNVGFVHGLGNDSERFDFDYGGPIIERTRFAVSGHYREGRGTRDPGVTVEDGGQLRLNVTRQFDHGYLRLSVKHLDDHAPTDLPVPVATSNGHISRVPGIDPRDASFYSPFWVHDRALTKNNSFTDSDVNDGLHVVENAFGAEVHFEPAADWSIETRFRKSGDSGRFIGIFPSSTVQPAASFSEFTGSYATGPKRGAAYAGNAFKAVVFNTSLDDLGLVVDDTRLSRVLRVDGLGRFTGTLGFFYSVQNLGLTWNFNEYLIEASGHDPALLSTGNATPGLIGPAFGACCERAYDARYRTTSPYFMLSWEYGSLNVDGGLRRDLQHASGTFNLADAGSDSYLASNTRFIDYGVQHNSYSIGGNYRLNHDLSLFVRSSDGVSFNADRILFNAYEVDGSAPIPLNTVRQQEAGAKWRRGPFSSFVTLFYARTRESNFEATTQRTTSRSYRGDGVEFEAGYSFGSFRISGGATLTDAQIETAEDATVVGHTPRRQARLVYQFAPSYAYAGFTAGSSIIGTTRSAADDNGTITLPAFAVVNLFLNYRFTQGVTAAIGINNLFDSLGYTEAEGDGHAARSIDGRSVRGTLGYSFD